MNLLASAYVPASPCPPGAEVLGEPPPRGLEYSCVSHADPENPKRHGWVVKFYPNGNKREECEYRQGERHGRCTLYSEEGKPLERGYWADGKRTIESWFWALPPEGDGDAYVILPSAADLELSVLVARRARLERLLEAYGASDVDATGLAAFVLAYIDDTTIPRRVACGASLCAGPGRVDEPIYIRSAPLEPEVERDREFIATWSTDGQAEREREQKGAAAELRRKTKRYKASVARYKKLMYQWERTHLRCRDGTRSPSCVCGRGSWQGCCSHHGGVVGCPRELPDAPAPPSGVPDELR